MAMAVLPLPFSRLSLHHAPPPLRCSNRLPPSSSHLFFGDPLSHGPLLCRPLSRRPSLVAFAAAPSTKTTKLTKKADSAAKRARQAEKNRIYNKARKSEMSTRIKKALVAIEELKKTTEPSRELLGPVETLISEAFSVIDKAVKVGVIHRNKGAHRKSRLSRAKRSAEIRLGWYTPTATLQS